MTHFHSSSKSSVTSERSTSSSITQPDSVTLDRRSVIKLIGSACAVSALGGCVIAKINNIPDLGSTFSFDLSDPKFEPLNTVGEAVDVDDAAGYKLILIRLNENEIMALDRICTHSQCDMKLDGQFGEWDGEKIICTCHNSHFSPRGEVLRPPATRPLPVYDVQFSSGSNEVQVIFGDIEEISGAEAGTEAGGQAGETAGSSSINPDDLDDLINPFVDDASAVEEGEMLYQQNCVFCHGEGGVGDAFPGADAFNIDQSQWSDGQMFMAITKGVEGTAMAAYEDLLTEEQCWQIVTYLRSLRTDE
jgi:Rieske Fe-S protein